MLAALHPDSRVNKLTLADGTDVYPSDVIGITRKEFNRLNDAYPRILLIEVVPDEDDDAQPDTDDVPQED